MSKPPKFIKTLKQVEAVKTLGGIARHIMLFGGSRSGKTFILIFAIIVRASKTKSRHVILRHKFNHAKRSIWLDTLPKVLKICFPYLKVVWKKSDFYIVLPNAYAIWIAGLDDSDRVEKILGMEFSTIYFNESSQIIYASVKVALTRLAEKNSLIKKVYYDENPPSKKHWSYWLFVRFLDPDENEPLIEGNYTSLLMNPKDNIENIDKDYIKVTLASMSSKDRARFEHGLFDDTGEGLAYYGFDRDRNVREFKDPDFRFTKFIGMDFNVDPMTAVLCYVQNDVIYIWSEVFERNSDTPKVCKILVGKNLGPVKIIPDSTGKSRKTSGRSDFKILKDAKFEIMNVRNPYVKDRVNNLNRLFEHSKIIIHPRCKKLINDLDKVSWNENNDLDQKGASKLLTHISDALGYVAWKLYPMKDHNDKITINI